MKKALALGSVLILTLTMLTACDGTSDGQSSPPPKSTSVPTSPSGKAETQSTTTATFQDGVLTTDSLRIEITDYKITESTGPVAFLGIWFSVTNLGDRTLMPLTAWNMRISGHPYEDFSDRLSLTSVSDDPCTDNISVEVAKGETVETCVAYVMGNDTTTVTLIGRENIAGPELGTMTLDLSTR